MISLSLARHVALVLALASGALSSAQAQAGTAPAATGLAADLLTDIAQLESKMLGLARAIPTDRYDWRPGTGVRSISEVLRHVAADNYLLPVLLGHAAPAATGITADFKSAQAFEQRPLDRDQTIAQLERSFAHVKGALTGTAPARMSDKVTLFGQPASVQYTWVLTATHLHEHLGQLIAYARSNNVVPPWSK